MRGTIRTVIAALALVALVAPLAPARAEEITLPLMIYRTGPFAPGGSGIGGGMEDYFALMNAKGGVEGMTFKWEECETAYDTARGVECYERHKTKALFFSPLSTGKVYALADRSEKDKIPLLTLGYGRSESTDGKTWPYLFPVVATYWSQASAMINYIAQKEGGIDKLKGKKIALLHLDIPYGREPIPILERLAREKGFEFRNFPLPSPGIEQSAAWVDIARRYRADYTLQWNWGASCTAPYKEMQKVNYPVEKFMSVWWCGSEEDVRPAGEASVGAVAAAFNIGGRQYPVMQDILEKVHKAGKGNLETDRVGTIYHSRGVVHGIILTEAMRVAIKAKGKPLTGEKMEYGLSNLNITNARIKELGAEGMMPEIKTTPENHGGISGVKMIKWDGKAWAPITDWIQPDVAVVSDQVKVTAEKVRAEKAGKK
jgi:branched-chain amino acid transport system substrate-binding protein